MSGFWWWVSALGALVGCSQQQEESKEFVARVGDSFLTAEQLPAPPDSSPITHEYVNDWVASELLYQEAVRRGVATSPEIDQRLDVVRRRLIVDALLHEELYADTAEITQEAISSYYGSHQNQFLLREAVALASVLHFDDRDVANTVRTRVLRGASWEEATREVQQDSSRQQYLLQATGKQYFLQSSLFPQELWKVARNLARNSISFVINTDQGYYLLFLYDFRHQGELADPLYVKQEIRDLLMIEARQLMYHDFLQRLHARFPVEVRLASSPEPPAETREE